MMNDYDEKFGIRAKIAISSLIVLFIAVLLLISSFYSSFMNDSVNIVNSSSSFSDSAISHYRDIVSRGMYSFLKQNGYSASDNNVNIREYTKLEQGFVFLVDVDSIQQTYRFYVYSDSDNYVVGCPYPEESKYPDSYCSVVADDVDDTSDLVLGPILPYDGSTNSGYEYRMFQIDADRDVHIHIFACEGDSAKKDVESSVKQLIKSRGANPDVFPLVYEFNGCSN